MIITNKMRLREIVALPEFEPMKDKFVASSTRDWMKEYYELTLSQIQENSTSLSSEDMLIGLHRLSEIAQAGRQYAYELKNGISLIHIPAKKKTRRTFALLLGGGGYMAVNTIFEALPVAARLNELGMDCFCLNYRTVSANSFLNGLMPKPLDDVASALQLIQTNKMFDASIDDYIIGGFSAGGHLASMWGTSCLGARHYGLPNPKMLMLVYPLITMEGMGGISGALLGCGMFGLMNRKKKVFQYSVNCHVDTAYPPVFLIHADNDSTVPVDQARKMDTALMAAGIPHIFEQLPQGEHGFGLGTGTPAENWPERALSLLDGISVRFNSVSI